MNNIADIPYFEVEFDKRGGIQRDLNFAGGFTDLFVISHGWNNDAAEARTLYTKFFTNFAKLADAQFNMAAMKPAIIGVFWPSKAFNETLAISGGEAGGTAAAGGPPRGQDRVEQKLDELKHLFNTPDEQRILGEAKQLVSALQDQGTARRKFVQKIRSLVDAGAVTNEDGSEAFFNNDEDELMEALSLHPAAVRARDDDNDDGGAAIAAVPSARKQLDEVVAAGNFASGFFNAAVNLLNYTTYYEMKKRAGTVGANGLAKVIDRVAATADSVHLIGHSFGGRLVTAAAAHMTTKKVKSLTLLQAAFSHNGFSASMNGVFRTVVQDRKIQGPIVITHSNQDRAVGIAYPLASRLNRDDRLALGDANDRFGGIGRNGAQQMAPGETVPLSMLDGQGSYSFAAGKIFNLNGDAVITGHGDVFREPCALAVLSAVAKLKGAG
jgi:hypothetical protein